MRSRIQSRRGQFIPIAAMVMLSVLVFMVGIVNVYKISRAKLKAQNLADAVALNVASQMAQSMNNVADRNEQLNHFNADSTNDIASSQAGYDPCRRSDPLMPPGLGCFIKNGPAIFEFDTKQGAVAYAKIVSSINTIQQLFGTSYNSFIGASDGVGATGANSAQSFQVSLAQQIPALQDPNIQVIVYNTASQKKRAQDAADDLQKSFKPNSPIPPIAPLITGIRYKTRSVKVSYNSCNISVFCHNDHPQVNLEELLGPGHAPVGWTDLDDSVASDTYLDTANKLMGAGAMVTISLPLIGLGSSVVQARSTAYMVMSAGKIRPTNGSFSPTYWVKLGRS